VLDEHWEISYPDAAQAEDGTIYAVYDFNRASDKEILMAKFTEADLEAAALVSANSRLRMPVNKAHGLNPRAIKPNATSHLPADAG